MATASDVLSWSTVATSTSPSTRTVIRSTPSLELMSYARIHWQNLANFGVLPLEFTDEADYDRVEAGDELAVDRLTSALRDGGGITVRNLTSGATFVTRHRLSARQVNMVLAGGQIPLLRQESLNT